MKNIRSFTALDFETLTAERSSACAIGLVKVIDGYITQNSILSLSQSRTHALLITPQFMVSRVIW